MPSIRKRIGYLPSIDIEKIIIKISTQEKLSQSKVVGTLVEEALIARGLFDHQNKSEKIRNKKYVNEKNNENSTSIYNEFDELISDKGISYNRKNQTNLSNAISTKNDENNNEELFEQFKQFILFQKMIQKK